MMHLGFLEYQSETSYSATTWITILSFIHHHDTDTMQNTRQRQNKATTYNIPNHTLKIINQLKPSMCSEQNITKTDTLISFCQIKRKHKNWSRLQKEKGLPLPNQLGGLPGFRCILCIEWNPWTHPLSAETPWSVVWQIGLLVSSVEQPPSLTNKTPFYRKFS